MYNPYETHLTEKILSASPIELTVMLYTGAQEAVTKARKCLHEKDIMGRSQAVSKAMEIVAELDSSVDESRGGELAKGLRELYAYVLTELQRGHITQQEQPFVEAGAVLATLLEGWKAACQPRSAEPLPYASAYAGAEGSRYSYAA